MKDQVRTTDIGPVSKKVFKAIPVSIELQADGTIIRDKAGETLMRAPLSLVTRRFRPGETKLFFRAHIASTVGALEIGERIEGW